MKNSLIVMPLSAFCLLTINGCSTVEGFGKDLQGAGQSISSEANKAKRG